MRVKYWSYILNDEGQPVEEANVYVYEAGTENTANVFTAETGGSYVISTPQVTTNAEGYFEFWVADNNESNGYNRSQKFKIRWFKANILQGEIDNLSILPIGPGYYYDNTLSWTSGASGYYYDINHGLGVNYPLVQFYNTTTKVQESLTVVSVSSNVTRIWNDVNNKNFNIVVIG